MTDFQDFIDKGDNFKKTLEVEVTHADGSTTKYGIVSESYWKKNPDTGELELNNPILSEGSEE